MIIEKSPPSEVKLKVQEALQEEAYKGIVRIDSQTMRQIDVRAGDIIEIEGGRVTVGIVDRAYPTDIGQSIIRMDGILRRNARTGIGELVKVRKADVKEAKSLTIAPSQQGVMIQADPTLFKRGLLGRAVVKGDIVALGGTRSRKRTMMGSPFEDIFDVFEQGFMGNFGFGSLKFIVADSTPKQPVIITENTIINISSKAIPVTEESHIPEVTYEDIGGLTEEVKKMREMVELPLKHPEIFERLGVDPPRGVLLHGPPGTGKTLIAKAVANESEANFLLVNGPELTSKFYGECVGKDSLVLTNGTGLTTIQEAHNSDRTHKIVGLNFINQKSDFLEIDGKYDKGMKDTLEITTPHGKIEATPETQFLVLDGLDLQWTESRYLKPDMKIATIKKLPKPQDRVPTTLDFLKDKNYLIGENVRKIFNLYNGWGMNKKLAEHLNVDQRQLEEWKYHKSVPVYIMKELIKTHENKVDEFKLLGKGKIPLKINKELMYVLGLLFGDGHLRYNHKDNHVSTVSLSNIDPEIIKKYKLYVSNLFGINELKFDNKNSYYFSSSIIGNLFYKLGIPIKNKSRTIVVPPYLVELPLDFIAEFIKGLFDTDGHVHLVKSGKQISYYSASYKIVIGTRLLLLFFGINSTIRSRKDGTHELTISDNDSIAKFVEYIGFTHTKRKENLLSENIIKYKKPIYDRIPIAGYVEKIKEQYNIPEIELHKININYNNVDSFTRNSVIKLISLLKKYNINQRDIEKLELLVSNDVIMSSIKLIKKTKSHIFDLTVPKGHNFIANGFIVHNTEKRIREVFQEAEKNAPSIIFIDEIDSIAPKREETYGEVERRMVSQLLTVLDGLKSRGKVVVIGATNRPNSLDPALRRPGRFDREIAIGVPDKKGRLNILKIHTRNMPLAKDVNLEKLAEITYGFVGADISALSKEAAMNVLRRIVPDLNLKDEKELSKETLDKLLVTQRDFIDALKVVRPSALREVLIETPNVYWRDIGGLEEIKQELQEAVEWPLKSPEVFSTMGIRPPRGVLLYGPPGTGKTLLAKAVANESEANFIYIKGPELISKWVGESEKGIRKIFEKARQSSPTVIFFDEIDSLASKRGIDDGSRATERVVNQLLTEMDGLQGLNDVVIIAATNRPDMIDSGLLRPGRFDKLLFVPVPDEAAREKIFEIHTRLMPISFTSLNDKGYTIVKKKKQGESEENIEGEIENSAKLKKENDTLKDLEIKKKSLKMLAEKTEGYVGADIEAVCMEAALVALRKNIKSRQIEMEHFEEALKKIKPSIKEEDIQRYKDLEESYIRTARAEILKIPTYLG